MISYGLRELTAGVSRANLGYWFARAVSYREIGGLMIE
jgi:hypothetical protein